MFRLKLKFQHDEIILSLEFVPLWKFADFLKNKKTNFSRNTRINECSE